MIITLKGANFSGTGNNIGNLSQIGGTFTFTINPTPSDATVKINGTARKSITGAYGTAISWEVSKNGYNTRTGSLTMPLGGKTMSVSLTAVGSVTPPVTPEEPGTGGDSEGVTIYYFKDTNPGYLEGGQYKESTKSGTTDYINISHMPKIGYYGRMGFVDGSAFHALEFYDSNKNYISSLSVLGTGKAEYVNIDLSSDSKYSAATYVRASVSQSSFTDAEFNSWYFIVGDFAVEQASGEELLKTMFPIREYIEVDGGFKEASSGAYRTDFIDITGKNTIEYKGRMGTIGLNYAFYDSNKTFISGLELVGDGNFVEKTINLSESKYSNAKYVVASISKGTLTDSIWFSSSFKIS